MGELGVRAIGDGFHAKRIAVADDIALADIRPGDGDIVGVSGEVVRVRTRRLGMFRPGRLQGAKAFLRAPPERRGTLLAHETQAGVWRFDIRMQGDDETVFLHI
jgi:hypothetical protein